MIFKVFFEYKKIEIIGLSFEEFIITSAIFCEISTALENDTEIVDKAREGASFKPSPIIIKLIFLALNSSNN